jgi:hypothetical protein
MKSEGMKEPYFGPLGLDRLPRGFKIGTWAVCWVIATRFALAAYHAEPEGGTVLGPYFILLALFGPALVAMFLARLAGVRWPYALLLLLFVPLGWFVATYIYFVPMILLGGIF